MKVRHILGLAIFCGAVGALGGQGVQAQPTNNSLVFVSLLLRQQGRQIAAADAAVAHQNSAERVIALLESITPTTASQARQINVRIAQLERTATVLQAQINTLSASLTSSSAQVTTTLAGLGNPSPFAQQAAQNAAVIYTLEERPPFGIPPVTSSQ